jgi:hypothetical protein
LITTYVRTSEFILMQQPSMLQTYQVPQYVHLPVLKKTPCPHDWSVAPDRSVEGIANAP